MMTRQEFICQTAARLLAASFIPNKGMLGAAGFFVLSPEGAVDEARQLADALEKAGHNTWVKEDRQ